MNLASIGIPALLGTLALVFGVGSLRAGWRKSTAVAHMATAGGWLLLAAGGYIATMTWGPEFGISYALAGIALCGFAVVFLNRSVVAYRQDRATANRTQQHTNRTHSLLVFLAAGPLAALASCQFVLACVAFLPGSEITRMAIGALLFPTLWGVTAAVSCMLGHPVRLALIFLIIAALSSALVYL